MKTVDEVRPRIEALEAVPTIPTIVRPLAAMLQLPVENVDLERVVEMVS